MKKILTRAAALLMAGTLIITLFGCEQSEPHPENEIIEYTITAEPQSLDPQIAADYSSILLITNLFEGLVREGADGEIKSGAAKSWDISENGEKYTFHLYEDTCWSNGDRVTADDFVFGITRALDPITRSETAPELFIIKNAADFHSGKEVSLGVNAPDENTVEITLEYPTDALLSVLTLPAAMPCEEKFFSETHGKYGKEPELLITNGPFAIRENYGWDHGKYIYIRRSENYKAGNPALPLGVNFTISDAPADRIAAITSENTDLIEIFGSDLYRAEQSGLTVTTTANTLWGICFNTDIKAFKNAKLRVALLGSLDRKTLLDDVPESYIKTSQLIADKISFGGIPYRKTVGDITLDKAQDPHQMFDRAVSELLEKEIELKNSYTVICLDDDTSSAVVTELLATWNEVTGSYFNKEPLSRSELEQRIAGGDYEIAVAPLNTSVDSPMEFLSAFRSDSMNNFIRLNYPKYDEFIDAAAGSTAALDMISSLHQAEKYLIEYGYLYPLYYESRYFASLKTLGGELFTTHNTAIDFTNANKFTEEDNEDNRHLD
ncbi:MAG: peptide ABC transporter substrate-binding protein [Clostridia bacterium]|nr:peptide ABC transporter substrate-binding protein [Clostridia bacterium]